MSNTEGYVLVDKDRGGNFVVQDMRIYYRNEGGMQVRSVAFGAVDGYPGKYEVDIPRTAVLFNKLTVGYNFGLHFDVYKSADGKTIFLENLRP